MRLELKSRMGPQSAHPVARGGQWRWIRLFRHVDGQAHRFDVFAIAALMLLADMAAYGQIVVVDGVLQPVHFGVDGSRREQAPYGFEVQLAHDQWSIRVSYAQGSYSHVVFDRTNVVQVLVAPLHDQMGKLLESESAAASIGPDGMTFPLDASVYAKVVWLALGSGRYFSETTNSLIYAPWEAREVVARYELSSNRFSFQVPAAVDFYGPLALYDIVSQSLVDGVASAFDQRIAEFVTEGQKTEGGAVFPQRFSLRVLAGGPKRSQRVVAAFEGAVHKVQPRGAQAFEKPPLPMLTSVGDRRFTDIDSAVDYGLTYWITNGVWPSKDAPWLVQHYERQRTLPARPRVLEIPGPARGAAGPAYMLLALAVLSPVVVLTLRWVVRRSSVRINQQQ